MSASPSSSHYPRTMIALHWGVVLLIAATYAMMELRGLAPRGVLRDGMKVLHYSFGLSVFALVFARIVIRLRTTEPQITPPLPWHMKLAATGAHLALYGFMIVMPLLGWATLSAEGKSPIFFGIPLFPITPVSDDLADFFEDTHELIANLGYFLIGAHAAAALYHHYIRRDNTLTRMAPIMTSQSKTPL